MDSLKKREIDGREGENWNGMHPPCVVLFTHIHMNLRIKTCFDTVGSSGFVFH